MERLEVQELGALDRDALLARWHAQRTGGTEDDGRYLIGVVSTGIYCLPSCTARQPKDANVRFFPGEAEARRAGLRACKRCRPDHFYRRYDPDRERLAHLARRVRRAPERFDGVADLRAASGLGATKLVQSFRRHYHSSPAAFLLRARLARAARLLAEGGERVVDVALAVGFDGASAFHESFGRAYGMSPGAYRRLGRAEEFRVELPADFRRGDLFGLFGRDPDGRTEHVEGERATKALVLAGRPVRMELAFRSGAVRVRLASRRALVGEDRVRAARAAHGRLVRMLGLARDPGPFERRMLRTRGMARLVRGRRGLRIPLSADAFESLVWVVVGQQVNLTFASLCRSRLIELCGGDAGGGFQAHPTPAAVAALEPQELTRLQFSRRKAEYLIDAARAIAGGSLDLEGLSAEPVGRIAEVLGAVRGLGPWSVQYLMMRAYGLGDCVPVGDAGLVEALRRFFELDARPDPRRTQELMEVFAPHRSLATYHLWKSLEETP